jgi:hypothetical protein
VGKLRAGITAGQRAAWLASDPLDWANESVAIAREPAVGYCVKGEPEKAVLVGRTYLDIHAAVVRKRIAMAGVRLAGLLNRALGAQPPETSLRAELLGREQLADLAIITLAARLFAGCTTEAADGAVFRLYRGSAADQGMAIHVATFDAPHGLAYNRENCGIAARLFQNQPAVVVTERVLPPD